MGQDLLGGRTWGWLEVPWLGSQFQTLSHPRTIMSSHLLFPFTKSFLGAWGSGGCSLWSACPDTALPQGAVEGCSMGFTKFCAALLNHPDLELQAIPRAVLEQVQYSWCLLFPRGAPEAFLHSLGQAPYWQLRCWCPPGRVAAGDR